MDVASLNLKFPVIGFTTDDDVWGFPSLQTFGVCGPRTIKDGMQDGMEIVDGDGRRFKVRSIRNLGREGFLPFWFLNSLVSTPQYRIEHELEAMPPLLLEEIKQRVVICMEAHPLYWSDDLNYEAMLGEQVANAKACGSVAEIFEVLGLDWFASY